MNLELDPLGSRSDLWLSVWSWACFLTYVSRRFGLDSAWKTLMFTLGIWLFLHFWWWLREAGATWGWFIHRKGSLRFLLWQEEMSNSRRWKWNQADANNRETGFSTTQERTVSQDSWRTVQMGTWKGSEHPSQGICEQKLFLLYEKIGRLFLRILLPVQIWLFPLLTVLPAVSVALGAWVA